jgi:hypothetical protein
MNEVSDGDTKIQGLWFQLWQFWQSAERFHMKTKLMLVVVLLSGILVCVGKMSAPSTRTIRGWFSDESCARQKVDAGKIEPTKADCTKKCLEKGVKLAFISETDKKVFTVSNPENFKQDIGAYWEVTGTTNDDDQTLHVDSAKKLADVKEGSK